MHLDHKTRVWYTFWHKYSKAVLIGGAGYFAIDVINSGEITSNTLIIGGSLVSAGILANTIFQDRIKIRGKRRLVIVD